MPARKNIDHETVIDIFLANGPYKLISRKYGGVSIFNISKIKTGRIHRKVTLPYDVHHGALIMNGILVSAAFGVINGPA